MTEVTAAPITGTKDWTFVTAPRRIPEDAIRMDICLMIYGPGKVWFDDITLVIGSMGEEVTQPDEVLVAQLRAHAIA